MTWNVIPLSAAPASPWRNGGGVTRELAAGPARDDWAWRISVAEVAADGPFSHFPGVQRWFAVVRGNGVRLAVDGKVHEVVASSEPLEFDGGAQVDSWLLAGATQDLNLMIRRERASARMMRLCGPQRVATVTESDVGARPGRQQAGRTACPMPGVGPAAGRHGTGRRHVRGDLHADHAPPLTRAAGRPAKKTGDHSHLLGLDAFQCPAKAGILDRCPP
jgi:environmental stress-induced protein Ves